MCIQYLIENNRGEKIYKVDGKALRIRNTLIFKELFNPLIPRYLFVILQPHILITL